MMEFLMPQIIARVIANILATDMDGRWRYRLPKMTKMIVHLGIIHTVIIDIFANPSPKRIQTEVVMMVMLVILMMITTRNNRGYACDFPDNCPRNSQTGWTSTRDFNNPSASTDWDNDGCKDDHPEDLDDDNDGILDASDNCPRSAYSPPRPTWVSDLATDMDGDGCRDSDEDVNDDGDAFDDAEDDCPTTYGTSTLGQNGCADSDQDGWSDNTDTCPLQAGNSTENGKIACLDSDGDGWANVDDDFIYEPTQWLDSDDDGFGDNANGVMPDACPTESGASIEDRKGCFDSDGDGYSNPDGQWGVNNGADAFINDDTQWSDFDGDGIRRQLGQ